jgi:hypothetical protein
MRTLRQGVDSAWIAVMGMTAIGSFEISLRHELTPRPEPGQTDPPASASGLL